ncbi:MAG: hypothetical protein P4L40_19185 [Terracidiphilus sp.]|nr:hypothetical protein [Terracidiphilus sp.]
MPTSPCYSADSLSSAPPGEGRSDFLYQAFTVAAILLVLLSVWIF